MDVSLIVFLQLIMLGNACVLKLACANVYTTRASISHEYLSSSPAGIVHCRLLEVRLTGYNIIRIGTSLILSFL